MNALSHIYTTHTTRIYIPPHIPNERGFHSIHVDIKIVNSKKKKPLPTSHHSQRIYIHRFWYLFKEKTIRFATPTKQIIDRKPRTHKRIF